MTDSTGLVTIVSRKAPPGVKSSFKQPIVNNRFVSDTGTPLNLMTYMHTRNVAETNYAYTATSAALSTIGLRSGSNKIMFLTFRNLNTYFTGAVTNKQTFLEIFTTQYITATPIANDDWLDANVYTNCLLKNMAGTDQTEIASCRYDLVNKGLQGSEYSRFRMGGNTASTFVTTSANFGWRNVNIGRMSSLHKDGKESAVIDFYVNAYSDAFTSDIKANFPRGLEYTAMFNGFVFDQT